MRGERERGVVVEEEKCVPNEFAIISITSITSSRISITGSSSSSSGSCRLSFRVFFWFRFSLLFSALLESCFIITFRNVVTINAVFNRPCR